MMPKRQTSFFRAAAIPSFLALFATLLLGGCVDLSPQTFPRTTYLLGEAQLPPLAKSGEPGRVIALQLAPRPEYIDREGLVLREDTGIIRYLPHAQWGESVDSGILRVLKESVRSLQAGVVFVRWGQGQDGAAREVLRVSIERFEGSSAGQQALLEGTVSRVSDNSKPKDPQLFRFTGTIDLEEPASLVAAHTANLESLAGWIVERFPRSTN
jgi:uncharacterized lipoprotein YmbA